MIARIATFNIAPPDDRSWVLETLKSVAGVHSAYHVRDPERGSLLSISVFDDEEGIQAAVDAISARAREIGHQGPAPDDVWIYEIVWHMWNR